MSVNSGARDAWRRSTKRPPRLCGSATSSVATFVTSFNAADVAAYRIVGTKGDLRADPAYEYAEGLEYTTHHRRQDDAKTSASAISSRPSSLYFSDCILKIAQPEPSGEEGLQDVRIVQALYESAGSAGRSRFRRSRAVRPTGRQRITRPGLQKPHLVKVQSASED